MDNTLRYTEEDSGGNGTVTRTNNSYYTIDSGTANNDSISFRGSFPLILSPSTLSANYFTLAVTSAPTSDGTIRWGIFTNNTGVAPYTPLDGYYWEYNASGLDINAVNNGTSTASTTISTSLLSSIGWSVGDVNIYIIEFYTGHQAVFRIVTPSIRGIGSDRGVIVGTITGGANDYEYIDDKFLPWNITQTIGTTDNNDITQLYNCYNYVWRSDQIWNSKRVN